MLSKRLPVPAYDMLLKCSHAFNVLDARGAVGVTERADCFATMRALAREVTGGCCSSAGVMPRVAATAPATPAAHTLRRGCTPAQSLHPFASLEAVPAVAVPRWQRLLLDQTHVIWLGLSCRHPIYLHTLLCGWIPCAGLWIARREELGHPLGTINPSSLSTSSDDDATAAGAASRAGSSPELFVLEVGSEELPPDDVLSGMEQLR